MTLAGSIRTHFVVPLVLLMLAHGLSKPAAAASFSRDILPLLSDTCFQCHGPDEKARKAKLRLDLKEGAFRVTEGKAIIAPGKSADSELFKRLISQDPDDVMPPPKSNRKLSTEQIALIRQWIDEGARWGEHWAFEKLTQPPLPKLKAFQSRVRNPIDQFILSRLDKEGLSPAPEAPREPLIRRVTLDLTGLPPTMEEVDTFLGDKAPNAYERLVDRLLNSPAFGERLAWTWLEAARYADSNGYQGDSERTMWPWRDWVVKAFNQNLPYDRFTIWQLAGDLLPSPSPEQKLATAFCRNHMINGEGGRIAEENRVDYVMDMAETTGTVWLGLTFNCCRCHDHKFDPLSRRDYYSFFGFFNQTPVDGGGGDPQTKPNLEIPTPEQSKKLASLRGKADAAQKQLEDLELALFPRPDGKPASESEKAAQLSDKAKSALKTTLAKRSKEQLSELEKEFTKTEPEFSKQLKTLRELRESRDKLSGSIVRVMTMEDMAKPRATFMLEKGLYDKRGEPVFAAVPAKLPPLPSGAPTNRLGLAQWLVSEQNPLTARVTVNHFWQEFFGMGLVKTPENFGVQSDRPSHPELLDWLSHEFIRSGWDVKALCHLFVTSAAYRQSSKATPELLERDPENRLLARGARYRWPSWMLRDQALAASGLLVTQVGGAPVKPYQPSGVWEEATFGNKTYKHDAGAKLHRRSLYTFWRRIVAPTAFFDTASRQYCSVKPLRTNSPLHALATLDDDTYVEAARAMAARVLTNSTASPEARIEHAFRLVLARKPSSNESRILLSSVERLKSEFATEPAAAEKFLSVGEHKPPGKFNSIEHAAYTALCLSILNLDEALTKE
jgi:hypothetical protein